MTKQQMLDLIRREHERLDETLGRLTPEEMTKPGLAGGPWSVKDTLAHITYWEKHPVRELEAAKRGEHLPDSAWPLEGDLPPDSDVEWFEIENQRVFEHYRNAPLTDVLADYRRSYTDMLDMLGSLDDADFEEQSRFSLALGESIVDCVVGNSYEHYQEHEALIRDWLEKAGQG